MTMFNKIIEKGYYEKEVNGGYSKLTRMKEIFVAHQEDTLYYNDGIKTNKIDSDEELILG